MSDINGNGLKYEFVVRKFSNTAVAPYDIVFKDYRENMKYSNPELVFMTAKEAQQAADELSKKYFEDRKVQYILNNWVIEGSI